MRHVGPGRRQAMVTPPDSLGPSANGRCEPGYGRRALRRNDLTFTRRFTPAVRRNAATGIHSEQDGFYCGIYASPEGVHSYEETGKFEIWEVCKPDL